MSALKRFGIMVTILGIAALSSIVASELRQREEYVFEPIPYTSIHYIDDNYTLLAFEQGLLYALSNKNIPLADIMLDINQSCCASTQEMADYILYIVESNAYYDLENIVLYQGYRDIPYLETLKRRELIDYIVAYDLGKQIIK